MDTNRKKRASAWFYQTLYRDEQIQPRADIPREAVPEEIRAMRALESGADAWRLSREAIFIRQAKRMAGYEDDYIYDRDVIRYFPTYQSLTDRELRGYFSWRTKWRRGERIKTNLSFAFLYIYELLNQIGVRDPVDGFDKLRSFEREYGALDGGICGYLRRWLWDYVVYYRLDPVLLADRPELDFDKQLAVLREPGRSADTDVFQAVLSLSSYRLDRSRLYAAEPELMEQTIPRVLRKMDAYYAAHRRQSLTEDYFGPQILIPVQMFAGAVFCFPSDREDFDYTVDALRAYRCRDGSWTVRQPNAVPGRSKKLGELVRTIDSMLREETGNTPAIQPGLNTKWARKLIGEEIRDVLLEREERKARLISFDFSKLSGIRHDATVTREKLIVDEEREEQEAALSEDLPLDREQTAGAESALFAPAAEEGPLTADEQRLLHALLYGGDLSWVRSEGLLLSVLVDGINEKLYDNFGDTVLLCDTDPELVEDYTEELKEMVKA